MTPIVQRRVNVQALSVCDAAAGRLLPKLCLCPVTHPCSPSPRPATQVDPSIIGGVILSLGDRYVDMSILARVKKLQQIVRDAV